jgi:hypothetical protein
MPDVIATLCAARGWVRRGSQIELPLAGGRTQRIELETFSDTDRERVRITTGVGAVASLAPDRLRDALRVNNGLAHGAIAIRGANLVLTDTFPAHGVTPEDVEKALRFLAETADLYELVLFGTDLH